MKRFVFVFPLLLALFLIAPFTAKACPTPNNVTVIQVDWHTLFSKLNARNIYAFDHYLEPVNSTNPLPIYVDGYSVVSVIFANNTAQITSIAVNGTGTSFASVVAVQNAPTLSKGLYIVAGYKNATGIYAYIFDIDKKVATIAYPYQARNLYLNFNGSVYYSPYGIVNVTLAINTVVNILKDLRNQGGNTVGWAFINNTGSMPLYYHVTDNTTDTIFSFNTTQYALAIEKPPFTVSISVGPVFPLCAGAYVIESYSNGNSTNGYGFQAGAYIANYSVPLSINTPVNNAQLAQGYTSTSTSTAPTNDILTPQTLMPTLLLILLADFVRDILEKRG
ncbi:MAG: hypothetical protein JHC26_04405 [Thermofilum sp.]|jgi:hypothetical protein|uniref:hypothetical protein n=1 Tax=Thermofilum sp. TaxID=1961369 RepID=UPI0025865120|nr:hypothetical protein [Thermofilum sp.]MCI4408309.1 hypothetical protein [Thermofilum sp.]